MKLITLLSTTMKTDPVTVNLVAADPSSSRLSISTSVQEQTRADWSELRSPTMKAHSRWTVRPDGRERRSPTMLTVG